MERTLNTIHHVTVTNGIYDTACCKHLDINEIDMTDHTLDVDCINCLLAKGFISDLHNGEWQNKETIAACFENWD